MKLLLKMGWRHGHSIKSSHTGKLYGMLLAPAFISEKFSLLSFFNIGYNGKKMRETLHFYQILERCSFVSKTEDSANEVVPSFSFY